MNADRFRDIDWTRENNLSGSGIVIEAPAGYGIANEQPTLPLTRIAHHPVGFSDS